MAYTLIDDNYPETFGSLAEAQGYAWDQHRANILGGVAGADIEAVKIEARCDTYKLLAPLIAKGIEFIQDERNGLADGITIRGELSTDPEDAPTRAAIEQMDRWLRLAHGVVAAADTVEAPDPWQPTGGVQAIAAERQRQIEVEGWTPEHDDEHDDGSLAMVAAIYAAPDPIYTAEVIKGDDGRAFFFGFDDPWPSSWDDSWDKRFEHDELRKLEIAGALIAAEIDRLDRATPPAQEGE